MKRLAQVLAFAVIGFLPSHVGAQDRKGEFIGTMVLEDVDPTEGRKFKLGQDLTYVDPEGARWLARKGLVFDGATIPQALWSFVGSPYTGLYRRAAIIHDFYCTHLYRDWQSVHRVFYNAMITDGVGPIKAKLMYYAVVRFGPRWTVAEQTNCPPGMHCAIILTTRVEMKKALAKPEALNDEASLRGEFSEIENSIQRDGLSAEQLETIALQKPNVARESTSKILTGDEAAKYGQLKFY